MLVEILVLGREESLDQPLGHGRNGHEDPPLAGELLQQRAIGGMDPGHHRRLVIGEILVVGQAAGGLPDQKAADAADRENSHATEGKQDAKEFDEHVSPAAHLAPRIKSRSSNPDPRNRRSKRTVEIRAPRAVRIGYRLNVAIGRR